MRNTYVWGATNWRPGVLVHGEGGDTIGVGGRGNLGAGLSPHGTGNLDASGGLVVASDERLERRSDGRQIRGHGVRQNRDATRDDGDGDLGKRGDGDGHADGDLGKRGDGHAGARQDDVFTTSVDAAVEDVANRLRRGEDDRSRGAESSEEDG